MPLRRVAMAALEQLSGASSRARIASGDEQPDARGGELECQRQAVEAGADRCDRARVGVGHLERRLDRPGPFHEERDGVGAGDVAASAVDAWVRQAERRDRIDALGGHAQRLATGGQQAHARRLRQRRARSGAASMTCSRLSTTSSSCLVARKACRSWPAPSLTPSAWATWARTSAWSVMAASGDEEDAVRLVIDELCGRRQGEPGLARAARARSASRSERPARRSRATISASSRSRPTSGVAWVGRLVGRASSVRSGGKRSGRPRRSAGRVAAGWSGP